MRKYLIGTLFGFALALSVGANAQEVNKLIDSVVQGVFPVTIDGASVGDAIVVNDQTYLPVREFGEAAGYDVAFTEDREVVLTTKITPPVVTVPPASSGPVADQITALNKKINDMKGVIANNKNVLHSNEELAKRFEVNAEDLKKMADTINASVARAEAQIADYQAQITALQAQQ